MTSLPKGVVRMESNTMTNLERCIKVWHDTDGGFIENINIGEITTISGYDADGEPMEKDFFGCDTFNCNLKFRPELNNRDYMVALCLNGRFIGRFDGKLKLMENENPSPYDTELPFKDIVFDWILENEVFEIKELIIQRELNNFNAYSYE